MDENCFDCEYRKTAINNLPCSECCHIAWQSSNKSFFKMEVAKVRQLCCNCEYHDNSAYQEPCRICKQLNDSTFSHWVERDIITKE